MVVNKVRNYRELKGISQDRLATLANVSRQTIISIEKGSYNPSIELGLKLAMILSCRLDELFQLEDING